MPLLSDNIDHVATIRQARYKGGQDYGELRLPSVQPTKPNSAGPTASPSTSAKTAATSPTATLT